MNDLLMCAIQAQMCDGSEKMKYKYVETNLFHVILES